MGWGGSYLSNNSVCLLLDLGVEKTRKLLRSLQ